MKTTIKYILLLALCISSIGIDAQSLSNAERRKMYMDVLNLINDYEKYAEVDGRNKRSFLRLFNDPATPIYNDLMGVSESETMPAHEYADSMVSQAKYPEVVIRNVLHDEPQYTDGKWFMNVSFAKELEYMDSCGIFEFSSKKHYGVDHQIKARVSWTDSEGAKFELLEGFIDTYVDHYPVNYMIFEPRNPKDTTYLLFKGNPIVTEYYDGSAYAILPKADTKAFKYTKDKDVHVKLKHDVNNKVYMTYKPKRWRVKARYEQAVAAIAVEPGYNDKTTTSLEWGNKSLIDVESDFVFNNDESGTRSDSVLMTDNFSLTSSVRAIGLDLGYVFPSRGSVKWGFFTGVALRQTTINSFYNGEEPLKINRWTTYEDEDADHYLRQYEFNSLRYSTKVNQLYFPAYFDMDIRCSNSFSFYFDLGAKLYWRFKKMKPVTAFSADYSVYGMYPQYGGVVFDEGFFGDYSLNGFVNNASISDTEEYEISNSNVYLDAFAGFGFRIRLYKDLFIDLGVNYQHDVSDIVAAFKNKNWINEDASYTLNEDWDYLTQGNGTAHDPLHYSGNEECVKSWVNSYYLNVQDDPKTKRIVEKGIDRRNAFQFNVGLMFRF